MKLSHAVDRTVSYKDEGKFRLVVDERTELVKS